MKKYKYKVFTSKIEEKYQKRNKKAGDGLPYILQVKQEYGLSTSSVQSGYNSFFF